MTRVVFALLQAGHGPLRGARGRGPLSVTARGRAFPSAQTPKQALGGGEAE